MVIELKNKSDTSADLLIYGDIVANEGGAWNGDDTYPSKVRKLLDECKAVKELHVHINSGGGSVFAGAAIANMLKAHNARVISHIDGAAASIASIIALAADEVHMPKSAYMMIHNAWCYAQGDARELRRVAAMLEKIQQSLIDTYVDCAKDGTDAEHIKALMDAETWLSAADAAQLFKKVVVDEELEAAALLTEQRYINMPDRARNCLFKAEQDADAVKAAAKQAKNSIDIAINTLISAKMEMEAEL